MMSDSTMLKKNHGIRLPSSKENSHHNESPNCSVLEKENKLLKREVSVLRAALEAYQQKEKELESLNNNLHDGFTRKHATATIPHDKSEILVCENSEHDDDTTSTLYGIKHRRTPLKQQRRWCDGNSLKSSEKFFPLDTDMEMASSLADVPVSLKDHHHHNDKVSFIGSVRNRAKWLVGLLILQSMSSFIISRNEALLQRHLVIVQFLTMLVGAGGNGGNQSSVHVIRGLATGGIGCWKKAMWREVGMGLALAAVLGVAGAIRASLFSIPVLETVAITMSLVLIVFISVLLGAALPLMMHMCGIDPAHSSTTIQVLMDILGVTITVQVSSLVLDSAA